MVLLASGLILSGCDPFSQPESMLDEYIERVARVLDLESRTSTLPAVPHLPQRRERTRELPELDIGILDFLSLYGCELQRLVGEKNSALGKVMQPAQRLQYEIQFIELARECLPSITDEPLQEALTEALVVKRKALPLAIWNATWGAPEMAQFFSLSDGSLPLQPDTNRITAIERDLHRLNAWVRDSQETPEPEMPDNLSQIHQRWQAVALAGQLTQSARLLIARLGDVARLIDQRLEGRPLCIRQQPNRQAEIMRNVFFNVYVARVQAYMASVRRVRDQLRPALAELALLQADAISEAFEPFLETVLQDGPGSIWARLDDVTMRHTTRWQNLLEQCGMRPQA